MHEAEINPILSALRSPKYELRSELPRLPSAPGLYAIYGDALTWKSIGIGEPVDDLPLYVGKAEDSLVRRDISTHFGNGRTGSSTVRRSFAALLRQELDLTGIPRNPSKPGHFSNYGLLPADDAKITQWMRERLQIAVWPSDSSQPLATIEHLVLTRLNPPLNIAGVNHRWKAYVQQQRKVMADQARNWQRSS